MHTYLPSRFAHNAEAKILSAEVSELGGLSRGLAIFNPRTGSTTTWVVSAERRDDDNDITMWVLEPTSDSCRKHPNVQNYTMVVYND